MKLTLVSVVINGIRHSAFTALSGKHISDAQLRAMFPAYSALSRGSTFSVG